MASTSKARSASVSSSLFPPLSDHGMPKSPSPRSPDGNLLPRGYSGVGLPASPRPSEPPLTPMSPPMSARSFGTFIDSEPSTPACSPRTGSSWEESKLVLLSPVPSSPITPAEPRWEMMVPMQRPPKKRPNRFSRKPALAIRYKSNDQEMNGNTSLSSHPVQRPVQHVRSQSQKEMHTARDDPAEEKKDEEGQTQSAPLDRLATKMKSLLRRKSDTDKKTEKKWKGYYELQRMETSHWTEL